MIQMIRTLVVVLVCIVILYVFICFVLNVFRSWTMTGGGINDVYDMMAFFHAVSSDKWKANYEKMFEDEGINNTAKRYDCKLQGIKVNDDELAAIQIQNGKYKSILNALKYVYDVLRSFGKDDTYVQNMMPLAISAINTLSQRTWGKDDECVYISECVNIEPINNNITFLFKMSTGTEYILILLDDDKWFSIYNKARDIVQIHMPELCGWSDRNKTGWRLFELKGLKLVNAEKQEILENESLELVDEEERIKRKEEKEIEEADMLMLGINNAIHMVKLLEENKMYCDEWSVNDLMQYRAPTYKFNKLNIKSIYNDDIGYKISSDNKQFKEYIEWLKGEFPTYEFTTCELMQLELKYVILKCLFRQDIIDLKYLYAPVSFNDNQDDRSINEFLNNVNLGRLVGCRGVAYADMRN